MFLAYPTRYFFTKVSRAHAPEIELYQRLGFPDSFTDGDFQAQSLWYESPRANAWGNEIMLKGGRVFGHPHTRQKWASLEWDGVRRPMTWREYQARVQQLAPSVSPESPLGRSLVQLDPAKLDPADLRWRRLADWWALSRLGHEEGLSRDVEVALGRMGALTSLRLAAELLSPGFARRVLVATHHWPPSTQAISEARLLAAMRDWPDEYDVQCRATGEALGRVGHFRTSGRTYIHHEHKNFAEGDRATAYWLGERHALTGDGEIWCREHGIWQLCGPAETALVAVPPRGREEH